MLVEILLQLILCHPFFTGKQGTAKKAGRVEKFNKKYGFDKKEN